MKLLCSEEAQAVYGLTAALIAAPLMIALVVIS